MFIGFKLTSFTLNSVCQFHLKITCKPICVANVINKESLTAHKERSSVLEVGGILLHLAPELLLLLLLLLYIWAQLVKGTIVWFFQFRSVQLQPVERPRATCGVTRHTHRIKYWT